ncbi:hypothetical protein EBZ39_05215 [bacterium]|nr:hypothetical protein [bacterium]
MINVSRGTSSYLSALNPVLDSGEPCLETDTGKMKYGDGTTPWNLLDYSSGTTVLPGVDNSSTGQDGLAVGGLSNSASGENSFVAGGRNNIASALNSAVVAGQENTVSGSNSSSFGGSENLVSGDNSASFGLSNEVSSDYGIAFGTEAVSVMHGQKAFSGGSNNAPGDAQYSIYNLRGITTSDTPASLFLDGEGLHLEIQEFSTWHFESNVTAIYDDGTASNWIVRGLVSRPGSGDASIEGQNLVESWDDAGGSVSVTAEGSDIVVAATGPSDKNGSWHATFTTVEVKSKPPLSSDIFVDIISSSDIVSMDVSLSGGDSAMYPSFDPGIHDYCVHAPSGSSASYTLTINGDAQTGTIDVNKTLHVMRGLDEYFIKIIPSNLPVPTISQKNPGYVPGYYLMNMQQATGAPYFVVYNENMVPVWYMHDNYGDGFALHWGGQDRLVTHRWAGSSPRYIIQLSMNAMSGYGHVMLNDERNHNPIWECHESHGIVAPASRAGNFISMTYAYGCGGTYMTGNGIYIQELSPDGQDIVWEWYSNDYFDIVNYTDHFHSNSIDVHPVTGDILVSNRHNGGGFCVDYQTKEVKWVLVGDPCCSSTGTMQSVSRPGQNLNTKWLSVFGDPYGPPAGNHDARWHVNIEPLTPGNDIVSFFDDRSNGGNARGVVYEIDMANNRAIFRAHAHSNTPSYSQGGYTLVKELDGSWSHLPNYHDQSPSFVEYNNGSSLDPNQNVVFVVDLPNSGNYYRTVKVRPDQLNIDFMRTTSGRQLTVL